MSLSPTESLRYARHLMLPEVGSEGQLRLKNASVLCIGAGGLGSPAALYLAAAGVGRIGIVDGDRVDASNLQRQILHGVDDVGRLKVESAQETLAGINPDTIMEPHATRLTSGNALEIIGGYDVVVDGTDNFPARYLINDACVLLGKPLVFGAIFRFEGQVSVFHPPHGPCYRCLHPEPPAPGTVPSCAEAGVLGVLPGVIGSLQATEAIKWIIGRGEPLLGRLLLYDALGMRFQELRLRRNPACPACGDRPSITELIDYEAFCGIRPALPTEEEPMEEITAQELKAKIDRGDHFVLVDVREPYEHDLARIPGARLIPLGQIGERTDELDPEAEIVLHCKAGVRSAKALQTLKSAGFARLKNLKGGILAWSDEVDPSVPKY